MPAFRLSGFRRPCDVSAVILKIVQRIVGIVASALLLYVLSSGFALRAQEKAFRAILSLPALEERIEALEKYHERGRRIERAYAPLQWAAEQSAIIHRAEFWYYNLWKLPPDPSAKSVTSGTK